MSCQQGSFQQSNNDCYNGAAFSKAAHHICEEARLLLSSLRGGPPVIARGELAQDLRDLRILVKSHYLDPLSHPTAPIRSSHKNSSTGDGYDDKEELSNNGQEESLGDSGSGVIVHHEDEDEEETKSVTTSSSVGDSIPPMNMLNDDKEDKVEGDVKDVGPYARPFLAVIMDPRASGPHTLVALRSLYRLFQRKSLLPLVPSSTKPLNVMAASLEPTMKGVLSCRFEQTDAVADEEVEMAISDLLCLLFQIDIHYNHSNIHPEIIMEAFHTVFITRNTFVHSPALCYHLEEVLTQMAQLTFTSFSQQCIHPETQNLPNNENYSNNNNEISSSSCVQLSRLILEFLVSQLLHTPLFTSFANGINGNDVTGMSGPGNEANTAHDATRILCLRLIRYCLQTGWDQVTLPAPNYPDQGEAKALLNIIQDDLCLALLMMGQAIWAYQDPASGAMPGILSIDVLSEICATLNTMWNIVALRQLLTCQLESIFTGFYQRALFLLRKLPIPLDAQSFQANQIFDAEVEIILESLVDILCLDHDTTLNDTQHETSSKNSGGALTTLFSTYDCNMIRSDVATGLIVELCRCCGATIGEDGEELFLPSILLGSLDSPGTQLNSVDNNSNNDNYPTSLERESSIESVRSNYSALEYVPIRNVPAHLKELCAEALVGSVSCLFQDPMNDSKNRKTEFGTTAPTNLTNKTINNGNGAMIDDNHLDKDSPDHFTHSNNSSGNTMPPDLSEISQPFTSAPLTNQPPDLSDISHQSFSTEHTSPSATENNKSINPLDQDQKFQNMDIKINANGNKCNGIQRDDDIQSLRFIKHKKRLIRKAAQLFNTNSSKGIQFLVDKDVIPKPITPAAVASFMRNSLVVGLEKAAVGEYLGQIGKSPVAGKSPPDWERDWFHKEVLNVYCKSFRFEQQSLLECLRMFLAAFRLPGEAQQIDRILQAFADSCSRVCDESSFSTKSNLKLFSKDEKKASDAAYLLSFSIIMLNTDLHNENIRPDRKMSARDFVKNNQDYGRDITDPGHELPAAFLEGIYESIREEPIRTEGEGADGVMTVERWKDVLRNSSKASPNFVCIDGVQLDDLKELVLENIWVPMLSAVGGFWGNRKKDLSKRQKTRSGVLGAQDARLGIDLAKEMLIGVRNLTRIDIFQQIFVRICIYTGLLGEYNTNVVERTNSFVDSVERQSAVIVAIQTAIESGDTIGFLGWKCVWGLIFELRDLNLLSGPGKNNKKKSVFTESDIDILTAQTRNDWNIDLAKACFEALGGDPNGNSSQQSRTGFFGSVGRALFGSDYDSKESQSEGRTPSIQGTLFSRTSHGKEELVIWNDVTASDDEDDEDDEVDKEKSDSENVPYDGKQMDFFDSASVMPVSDGAAFEHQLLHEDKLLAQSGPPVTGLETLEDTERHQLSPRARVRKRLALVCNFSGLVSESRFLDVEGIHNLLHALIELIQHGDISKEQKELSLRTPNSFYSTLPKINSDLSESIGSPLIGSSKLRRIDEPSLLSIPLSPASEALAEVLLCEIALKNRDRISSLWKSILRDHYHLRLHRQIPPRINSMKRHLSDPSVDEKGVPGLRDAAMEKCVTGLLRLSYSTVNRIDIVNDVLESLTLLVPPKGLVLMSSSSLTLDKHLAEGLWRICRNVDDLCEINEGWNGILGLTEWCAMRGEKISRRNGGRSSALSEDDPALQAFRSIHLLLHSEILKNVVPLKVVYCIRALISGGEKQNCPKLSIAGLDLLLLLHTRLQRPSLDKVIKGKNTKSDKNLSNDDTRLKFWVPVLQGIAEAGESNVSNVRQHAISMLTDAIIDKNGSHVPEDQLCRILTGICVPLAGNRINELLRSDGLIELHIEEVMIELEMCVSLVFKPFLHYLKRLSLVPNELTAIWISMLAVMAQLLGEENVDEEQTDMISDQSVGAGLMTRSKLLYTTKELASEHLRNAVMVLVEEQILSSEVNLAEPGISTAQDITSLTWSSIDNMHFCKQYIQEWKDSASKNIRSKVS